MKIIFIDVVAVVAAAAVSKPSSCLSRPRLCFHCSTVAVEPAVFVFVVVVAAAAVDAVVPDK